MAMLFNSFLIESIFCFNLGSSQQLLKIIETAIGVMNKTDFYSGNEQELLESVLRNATSESSSFRDDYLAKFVNKGGLDVIKLWLDQFSHLNSIGNKTDLLKFYCGRTLSLCFFGALTSPFRYFIIKKGVIEALLRLVFTSQTLFGDTEFTKDSLAVVVHLVAEVALYERQDIHSVLTKVFGSDFVQVQNRFKTEENPVVTLLLAGILLEKYNSVFDESDTNIFTVDQVMLWYIRDNILPDTHLRPFDSDLFILKTHFFLSYQFVPRDISMNLFSPHILSLQYFNIFLVSDCNRLNLCSQLLLDFYLEILDQFAINFDSKKQHELTPVAIRGLFLLTLTCLEHREYVQKRMAGSKYR